MSAMEGSPHSQPLVVVDGKYQAVRPIARGGMGEVIEATHRYTKRNVAVKLALEAHVNRSAVRERLLREAHALGSLVHSNIVALHDAGECPRHGAYLVIEKLEGRSLDGLLAARTKLGADGTVHLLREMASALVATHERGLVHRDVKPANIFVSHVRPGLERVKLLDFGVVGAFGTTIGAGLTRAGELLGTFTYMAPEQLQDASRCDPRADLYSLGIVALESLGADVTDISSRLRTENVASRAFADTPEVPAELVRLLDEMTAAEVSRRPAHADVVLNRLAGVPGAGRVPLLLGYGKPTEAQPPVSLGTATTTEARRDPRAPYVTPVRMTYQGGTLDARSEDISSGGMLVVASDGAALAGDARLRFALPTTGRVANVDVRVRWVRRAGGRTALGLEFVALEGAARESIATYVQWLGV